MYCHICKIETKYDEKSFKQHHLNKEHPNITESEYYNKFIGKIGICEVCNKETTFYGLNKGYSKFHKHCISKSKEVNRKRDNTIKEKYGVDNISQLDSIKLKKRSTIKEKYGVDNISQLDSIKLKKEITTLNNFGVKNPRQSKIIINKAKQTNIKRYGVDSYSKLLSSINHNKKQIKNIKDNEYKIIAEKYNLEYIEYTFGNNSNSDVSFSCKNCNSKFTIQKQLLQKRIRDDKPVCLNCNKNNFISKQEINILKFIKEHYNGKVISQTRSIISKELDIYLPEIKLAIEFNGLYWHSEIYKDKNYHLNKTEECESNGIQLIHIYEDDWSNKSNIVKSRLLNLLGKSERIYARKCIIKSVTQKESRVFLNENHIQGNINSKFNYGLYYQDELVSLMTFDNGRFKHKKIELLRFCNKLNKTVIGGASKLFKYALKINNWNEILSYADRSWSNGNLYKKLDFKYISKTPPNYFYIISNIRENRFKYRKSELIKQGFDKSLTEHQIMKEREIYRIYNSGNLKFIYNR